MAGGVVNFKVCNPLKLRSGLTENYHAICHCSYNLPLAVITKPNPNDNDRIKYGITLKIGEKYFYLTAIPTGNLLLPNYFTRLEIPKGEYEKFTHKGKMESKQFLRFIKSFYRNQI